MSTAYGTSQRPPVDAADPSMAEARQGAAAAAFLGEIDAVIAPLATAGEIVRAVGPLLAARFGLSRHVLVTIDEHAGEVIAVHEETVGQHDAPPGRQFFRLENYLSDGLRRNLSKGLTLVCEDVETDPHTAGRAEVYRRYQVRSQVLVPHIRDGQWRFLFVAQRADSHVWLAAEVDLIQEMALRFCMRLERAEAEAALRETEQRYRTLFEEIDQGFCLIDVVFAEDGTPVDYLFVDVNPAFARQTGLSDVIGRRIRDLAPDLETFWFETYGRVAETGEPVHFVSEARAIDGRWFDVSAFRLQGSDSRRVGVLFTDITAQRRTEEALRASEERFRTLFQRSADAVQLVTIEGRILFSSDSVETVLGYRPDEIEGEVITPYIHPDDRVRVFAALDSITGEPGGYTTLTYRVRHRDGSWAWLETTLANHLETPHLGVIVGNFRNVTARVELERQKDDFLAVATHELKTPVTSLKGYAQVLRNRFRKAGDEASATLMGRMDRQLDKLTALIGDLLDVTRLDTGTLPLQPQAFDLDELAHETVGDLQLTTERHRIVLESAGGTMVEADRDRTGQVLINFLANAILYSGDHTDITVTVVAEPDRAGVTVRDRGIGIPAGQQDRVFDRFYRVQDVRGEIRPGLGLGLYISAEIVRRQGGEIWVASREGEGSTFGFWLPRLRAEGDRLDRTGERDTAA